MNIINLKNKKLSSNKKKFSITNIFMNVRKKILQIYNILMKNNFINTQSTLLYKDILNKVSQISKNLNKKYNIDNTDYTISEFTINNFINELKRTVSNELLEYTDNINTKINTLVDDAISSNIKYNFYQINLNLEKLNNFYADQISFIKENVKKIYIGQTPLESLSKSKQLDQLLDKINQYIIENSISDNYTDNITKTLTTQQINIQTKQKNKIDNSTLSYTNKNNQNIDKLKNLNKIIINKNLKNKNITKKEIDNHKLIEGINTNNKKTKNKPIIEAVKVKQQLTPYVNALYNIPQIVKTNNIFTNIDEKTQNIYQFLYRCLNVQQVIPAPIPAPISEKYKEKYGIDFEKLRPHIKNANDVETLDDTDSGFKNPFKIPWLLILRALRLLMRAVRGLWKLAKAGFRKLTQPIRRWWKNLKEKIWGSTLYRPKKAVPKRRVHTININMSDDMAAAAKNAVIRGAERINAHQKKTFDAIWEKTKSRYKNMVDLDTVSARDLAKLKQSVYDELTDKIYKNAANDLLSQTENILSSYADRIYADPDFESTARAQIKNITEAKSFDDLNKIDSFSSFEKNLNKRLDESKARYLLNDQQYKQYKQLSDPQYLKTQNIGEADAAKRKSTLLDEEFQKKMDDEFFRKSIKKLKNNPQAVALLKTRKRLSTRINHCKNLIDRSRRNQ